MLTATKPNTRTLAFKTPQQFPEDPKDYCVLLKNHWTRQCGEISSLEAPLEAPVQKNPVLATLQSWMPGLNGTVREHINAFVKTTQELLENPETSKEEEDYIRRERWYATPLPTRHGLETQLGHLSELNGLWYFAPFISDDYAIMQRIHIGVKNTLLAGYTGANAKKQEKPCSITVWSLNKSLCINTTFKKQPGAVLFNTATNTPSGQIFAGPAHHGMLGTLRRVVLALHTMARTPLNQPVGKLAARLASKWHKTYHPITTHINPDDRLLHLPNLINGFPHETAVQIHPDCTPENAGKILEELYQEPNPGTVPPAHPQPPRLRAIRRLCPD